MVYTDWIDIIPENKKTEKNTIGEGSMIFIKQK